MNTEIYLNQIPANMKAGMYNIDYLHHDKKYISETSRNIMTCIDERKRDRPPVGKIHLIPLYPIKSRP